MAGISELPSTPIIPKQLITSNLYIKLKLMYEIFAEVKMKVAGIVMFFNIGSFKGRKVFYSSNKSIGIFSR
jgi:hypothetical protein